MRVLLVSTTDLQGGAARAAYRLMRGLRAAGEDCSMLVRTKTSTDPHVHAAALENSPAARQYQDELYRIHRECIDFNRTPVSNTWFSLPGPGYDISGHQPARTADVIHLHWVSQFLSPVSVARLQALGKPVVWTIHDQRPFTGGCHYSCGCTGFVQNCCNCPQLVSNHVPLTRAALDESLGCLRAGIVVISPSRWMADCARRSALFSRARVEVIPNGVDTTIFRPGRAAARKELGLEPDHVYLLAGADAGAELRKGFHILREAIETCRRNERFRQAMATGRIQILFFGASIPDPGFPVRQLGQVESEAALARIYAGADGFLLPSIEDNLPNTMLEALCCGTPVIGFNIGGLPDVIESGINGLLAAGGDTAGLALHISDFADNAELRRKLGEGCIESRSEYDLSAQARKHRALYAELCEGTITAPAPACAAAENPLVELGAAFSAAYPELLREARKRRFTRRWHSFWRRASGVHAVGHGADPNK